MKQFLKNEEGQTLVWVVLGMIILLGMAALAIDGGNLYLERRRMQNAADAAALAGAQLLCEGTYETAVTGAVAMANEYAIIRNFAAWATPVPSKNTIGGKIEKAMQVTAGETVNNYLAGLIGAGSTVVSASAKARCEKTTTGCATWPLTVEMPKFTGLACGESFVISIDQNPYGNGVTCPTGCDCSHVFVGIDSSPQVGWLGCDNKIDGHACDAIVWSLPQCVDANPGSAVGTVGGGGNGQLLLDWVAQGNAPVRIPLFECYNCGQCTAGEKYKMTGFGCFKLDPAVPWIKNNYALKPLSGQTCTATIAKVIQATVDCNCTISCGTGGGLPDDHDATIPVLVD